ncbi:flagellar hook-basal body complex protein [Phenylobacterium sp.]|uniref:flagellar hook-basal body complex protein n=1 Tax=Phenylobacterium sp. TaxID=1871053 RepID=UPI001201B9C6|nr:flagellar hook-basal body complex protein [Phenylobacterium sp.]THD62247.1 MAG: flagellar hook-basal body complex protein [Phenylobacterium sp.]
MDNSLYVGLSNQMVLKRQLDIVANNIANADTNGFKVESLITSMKPGAPAFTQGGPRPVKFVGEDGVARDFSQGGMRNTAATYDLAIEGQGFFKVTTASGQDRYTRDGHFRTDDQGHITTQSGETVADDGGGSVTIDPQLAGEVTISPDGIVSQGNLIVGKIGVYKFDNLSALEKVGDNEYQNASNQQATVTTDAKLHQGMLEGSNVNQIVQITKLIAVNRAYEQVTQMMSSQTDLSRTSVGRLGKATSS